MHRKYQAAHLASHGVAKPTARFVQLSEVYPRGVVSASGIRFFSGSEDEMRGKCAKKLRR